MNGEKIPVLFLNLIIAGKVRLQHRRRLFSYKAGTPQGDCARVIL